VIDFGSAPDVVRGGFTIGFALDFVAVAALTWGYRSFRTEPR
jgi:hypothetical protein